MRLGRIVLPCVVMFLSLLGGCAEDEKATVRTASFFDRLRPGHEAHNADLISLEVALVERPIYDTYLDQGLWDVVDEHVGSLLSLAALQANGFRVGQLGGNTPPELLRMLTSDRSCSNPREIGLHSGGSTTLSLGPAVASSSFRLIQGNGNRSYQLDRAQFELVVTPTLTSDGRTCLKCVPQVRHGEEAMVYRPVQGGWIQQPQRQVDVHTCLGWEITVAPNEFVIIGGKMDLPDTLGHQCFVRPTESPPVRRLLVLRSVRAVPAMSNESTRSGEGSPDRTRAPSIAEQAAQSGD